MRSSTPPPALGDELIPDANMVFDRVAVIEAGAGEVWPWLLQLGKRRKAREERVNRVAPRPRPGGVCALAVKLDPCLQVPEKDNIPAKVCLVEVNEFRCERRTECSAMY